jgi:hypothetical protein
VADGLRKLSSVRAGMPEPAIAPNSK